MARIGAAISATAPFIWVHVARIRGGWITDNFGLKIDWTDGSALGAVLAGDDNFCRDNPLTAMAYHGTTSAYRQIPKSPGAASMHVITAGSTEVHIDVHQPVEGKETSWPWAGQCDYDLSAWSDHASDVMGGGGAAGTAVGRCASARDGINKARVSGYFVKEKHGARLDQAEETLNSVGLKVQKYAAMGAMIGNEWEGEKEMLKDVATMSKLEDAEKLISEVRLDEELDDVSGMGGGMGGPGGMWAM